MWNIWPVSIIVQTLVWGYIILKELWVKVLQVSHIKHCIVIQINTITCSLGRDFFNIYLF